MKKHTKYHSSTNHVQVSRVYLERHCNFLDFTHFSLQYLVDFTIISFPGYAVCDHYYWHGKALKDAYADVSLGLDVSCGCHMWQYFYSKDIRERSRLVHIFMQGHQLKENVFSPILEQNIMQLSCLMQVWMLL
ncbi:uncharacterized protein LOC110648305 [Hevea brasiliensis]|uniref:uncharacterized protein LOC110648305 n=1 Tax=Hevea brasiliensis TaxID=3981 RepID=UPI0025D5E32C|nr:uncharacterized protein LOC110648305 [Hevea brasiliensis]XP_058007277.1 uncharacterized protein LOC110648305 [Hevea brasiliensis]